jgi:ferric-dicitrate binding protein FerR (iron transport regulator)
MNQRDIERLSEYLDGRLDSSDSARLESRLASDPALASALDALREPRALLRRMPHRRAPRNFTLTPKMVGRRPPLPRSYPVFRFATALATLLFGLSFITNQVGQLAASAPSAYEIGRGGGSDMPATEAPAMEMALATEPPAPPEFAPTEMATVPMDATPESDANRAAEEPAAPKSADEPAPRPPLLNQWQIAFGGVALLGAAGMFTIRKLAARKWKEK